MDREKAVSQMELVQDWLESDNPLLKQIAEQTFDDLFIPTVKAQLEWHLKRPGGDYFWLTQELLAMLVLSREHLAPSTREWMRQLLITSQIPAEETISSPSLLDRHENRG